MISIALAFISCKKFFTYNFFGTLPNDVINSCLKPPYFWKKWFLAYHVFINFVPLNTYYRLRQILSPKSNFYFLLTVKQHIKMLTSAWLTTSFFVRLTYPYSPKFEDFKKVSQPRYLWGLCKRPVLRFCSLTKPTS